MGGPLDPSYRDCSLYYGGITDLLSLPAFQHGDELTGEEKSAGGSEDPSLQHHLPNGGTSGREDRP
jgi:hypothetical protein